MSKYKKRLSHSFLYFVSQIHLYPLCLFIFPCCNFDESIFNIILFTLVTKYTVILNFNFSHTIYPQLCIVPLYVPLIRPAMVLIENSLNSGQVSLMGPISFEISILVLNQVERWERKRSKWFFTYIHLDRFRSHPSKWS